MQHPLTITIEQTGDGRYRACYSDPTTARSDAETKTSGSNPSPTHPGMSRSIEAENFDVLMDHLRDLLGPILTHDRAGLEVAIDADEDSADLADAREAMDDVRKNGGIPWEQVEAEMRF